MPAARNADTDAKEQPNASSHLLKGVADVLLGAVLDGA